METRDGKHYLEVMLKTIITQITDRFKSGPSRPRSVSHTNHLQDDVWYAANPLAHPDLQRMDQRELGDLPFEPRCIRSGR